MAVDTAVTAPATAVPHGVGGRSQAARAPAADRNSVWIEPLSLAPRATSGQPRERDSLIHGRVATTTSKAPPRSRKYAIVEVGVGYLDEVLDADR